MPQTFYTESEYDRLASKHHALEEAYDCFSRRAGRVWKAGVSIEVNQTTERPNKRYYSFVPCEARYAIDELSLLVSDDYYDRFRSCFLDVGCGIGNIMAIAESMGHCVNGIEYNKALAAKAVYPAIAMPQKITLPTERADSQIFIGDAFSFNGYHLYDIVYMYCPVSDSALESKLERLIEDKLKVGAVFVCNMKQDGRIRKDKRFESMDKNYPVWRKISN